MCTYESADLADQTALRPMIHTRVRFETGQRQLNRRTLTTV